ncbi:hypothetical protein BH10PLA1_BH10PLA1_04290 [soil metagenome]
MPTATAPKLRSIEHVHGTDDQAIAITALLQRGNTLYCGLTAGRYALVPFDLDTRKFGKPVDLFPWVDDRPQTVLSKIHNGMGLLDNGKLVIGEGVLFTWDGLPFEYSDSLLAETNHRRGCCGLAPLKHERIGTPDLASFDLRTMKGGKVLVYDPDNGSIDTIGQVQPFNYVQSMIVDPKRRRAYGHTLGDCHFFDVNIDARTIEDHGRISTFGFHNLCIINGVVYGAWVDFDAQEALRILRFDPDKPNAFLERLPQWYLPSAGPRVQGNRGIDQWLVHSDGTIYVGMAGSGVLYKFDPKLLTTTSIGRIGQGGRVTSLVEDELGRVIFTGGFPRMHIGRYDPRDGQIEDFGPVTDRYEKIYFHGCAYSHGALWLAETDAGVASLWEVHLPE